PISDLRLAVDRGLRALPHVRRCRPRPGGADAGEMGDGEIGARTDGDRVRGRIETGDEPRSAVRSGLLNAQALALSDRIGHRPVVLAEHLALGVLDESRTHG